MIANFSERKTGNVLADMKFAIILQFMHARSVHTGFTYAHYRAPCKAHAYNEKLKSAQNEHKNESFYAYINVMRLCNIVHHYFFRFCRIYAIIAIKTDFVIH